MHYTTRPGRESSPARVAARATAHCFLGCAIGEVAGMVMGTSSGWSNATTVAVSIALAFVFGYSLTLIPLRRAGLAWRMALGLAFASDTISIAVMEAVDNLVMLVVPGAMEAPLASVLFWGSLGGSLGLAFFAAWPVNRWLIGRGRGHAVVHAYHGGTHVHHDSHEHRH